jgi:DNA-binding transcriptional ArsR family regulator
MAKDPPEAASQEELPPVLPDTVPVTMPDIPIRLTISTEQQFKATSDMMRSRILGVIQYQPLTAKQIAQRLQATPGAIGHHLRVLEEAGLVKIVARRLVHGIVACYYTRAARLYDYEFPQDVTGSHSVDLDFFSQVRAEMMDSLVSYGEYEPHSQSFPHARLSPEKAQEYFRRFNVLLNELIEEKPDPNGEIYGVFFSIFKAPPSVQVSPAPQGDSPANEGEDV